MMMNEEEVKIKIVIPWLKECGIDIESLSFEESFKVQIGRRSITHRGVHPVNGVAGARYDILVKNGNKNLMVVEVKGSDIPFTDAERDQAISYARLVHPIAPYTAVTNGKDFRLFDSISKDIVNEFDINVNGITPALPAEDIYLAQSLFLASSPANLVEFSKQQADSELDLLRGSLIDGKKYESKLHVKREAVWDDVFNFYQGACNALVLEGQSGIGKSCEMCAITEWLLENQKPVLFFNGVGLEGSLVDAIADEFAWVFNDQRNNIEAVRRLVAISGEQCMTIMVDAIDEWRYGEKVAHLSKVIQATSELNIKFIFSTKASNLHEFMVVRDVKTHFANRTEILNVKPFIPREFHEALKLYKKEFRFDGAFERSVFEQAKNNPFFMRILFDVAAREKLVDLTFGSVEIIDSYLEKVVARTSNKTRAINTIKNVARLLFLENTDALSEDYIVDQLKLENIGLMEELFQFNVLVRHQTSGDSWVSFYFQQLRDHVIAFKVEKLQNLDDNALKNMDLTAFFVGVRKDVLTYYYRLAKQTHKEVYDSIPRRYATAYLERFKAIVHDNFPMLEKEILSVSPAQLGLVGSINLQDSVVGVYGFRKLLPDEPTVYFLPIGDSTSRNLIQLHGADSLIGRDSICGFKEEIDFDPEIIGHELSPKISNIVENGVLNERSCPSLVSEYLVETILEEQTLFKNILAEYNDNLRPVLEFDEIQQCLLKRKLYKYYEDKLTENKIDRGEIKMHWSGSIVSYTDTRSDEDFNKIHRAVDESVATGKVPKDLRVDKELHELTERIESAIDLLKAQGFCNVTPILGGLNQYGAKPKDQQDIEGVKKYVKDLFCEILDNYVELVRHNFADFVDVFLEGDEETAQYLIVVQSGAKDGFGRWSMGLGIFNLRTEERKRLIEVLYDVHIEFDHKENLVAIEGKEYRYTRYEFTSVNNFYRQDSGLKGDKFSNMPLRAAVYSRILKRLPRLFEHLQKLL